MLTRKIVKLWFRDANDTQVSQLLNYYQEVKEDKVIIKMITDYKILGTDIFNKLFEVLKETANCASFKKMKEAIKLKAELDLAKDLHS